MRRSELERAVAAEFGSRAGAIMADLVLPGLGDMTAAQALVAGVPSREIWLALCDETEVPAERRYGAGRLEPGRRWVVRFGSSAHVVARRTVVDVERMLRLALTARIGRPAAHSARSGCCDRGVSVEDLFDGA